MICRTLLCVNYFNTVVKYILKQDSFCLSILMKSNKEVFKMKWFKHFTDNHRGRSVQRLMDKMGHSGLAYYILMELCAEKLEKHSENPLVDSDCEFSFHPRVVENALRMKRKSTKNLLETCQE